MLTPLLGLNTNELRAFTDGEGHPAYRGTQLAEWLYLRGAHEVDDMTSLPETLRKRLAQTCRVGRSCVVVSRRGRDGTVKLLLEQGDGARVETVGLPYADRLSCCVSTQVGCPVGCVFCATGRSGYVRDLSAGEIVDQVLTVQEAMRDRTMTAGGANRRVDHVTFMGMGEPLLNYDATLKAIRLLNGEMGIAMRHLTVSTAGFLPGIRRLAAEELQLTLAVSLHAPTDELRHRLMPGMAKWTIGEIVDACHDYIGDTGRRVTFEYCLLKGVNDSISAANQLAAVLRGLNCHVNLIAFNPVRGMGFLPPPRDRIKTFRECLDSTGIQVTQRVQRGADIDAACGQLRHRMVHLPPGMG